MRKLMTFLAAALVMVLSHGSMPARADSEQQNLIEEARITLDHLRRDREFGNALELMHHAKGIMIVPNLVKGGFFIGGEGGAGLLMRRAAPHNWTFPAFYTLASASFGLQIGLESAEMVIIVLTDRGMQAFMSDEFKVGAQAGIAVVTLGATAEASTSSALGADMVVWSSATGAYAGLTLNGSIIKPRDSWSAAYYGQAILPADVLLYNKASNPAANPLRAQLGRLE